MIGGDQPAPAPGTRSYGTGSFPRGIPNTGGVAPPIPTLGSNDQLRIPSPRGSYGTGSFRRGIPNPRPGAPPVPAMIGIGGGAPAPIPSARTSSRTDSFNRDGSRSDSIQLDQDPPDLPALNLGFAPIPGPVPFPANLASATGSHMRLQNLPDTALLRIFDQLAGWSVRGEVRGGVLEKGRHALALALTCRRLLSLFRGQLHLVSIRGWRVSPVDGVSVRARTVASLTRLAGPALRTLELGDLSSERLPADSWVALLAHVAQHCPSLKTLDTGIPSGHRRGFRLPFTRHLRGPGSKLRSLSLAATSDDVVLAAAASGVPVEKLALYDIGTHVSARALRALLATLQEPLRELTLEGSRACDVLSSPPKMFRLVRLRLHLPLAEVSDVFALVCAAADLEVLELEKTRLSVADIERVTQACAGLRDVALRDCDVPARDFRTVFGMLGSTVVEFGAHYRGSVSGGQLAFLAGVCPHLRGLSARAAPGIGGGISLACDALRGGLQSLALRAERDTDEKRRRASEADVLRGVVAAAPTLRTLHVETPFTAEMTERVLRFAPHLKRLTLANVKIDEEYELAKILDTVRQFGAGITQLDVLHARHLQKSGPMDRETRMMNHFDGRAAIDALDKLELRNPFISSGDLRHYVEKAISLKGSRRSGQTWGKDSSKLVRQSYRRHLS